MVAINRFRDYTTHGHAARVCGSGWTGRRLKFSSGLLHHVSATVVAELLTMKLQPVCDLVDLLAIRMQSDANELKSLSRNCLYRSPVVSIVVGDKQAACVDGWGQPALICATQSSRKLMARRRIDQDRLPNERAVSPTGCIDIGFTRKFRASSNKPSCQEASDIESLPHDEIIAYNYHDLGIEAHGQAYSQVQAAES